MKEKKEILKILDDIVFHDMPVQKISFINDHSPAFTIYFSLYNKERMDYDYWTLRFHEVKELKSDSLILYTESDLEISSFDYEFNEQFECKILFLLGFGQPSYEVVLKCEKKLN